MTAKPSPPIYVVDDDPVVRESLALLLGAKRFVVETFESAEAFLARLGPDSRGCAIVDVRMPGMSGIELQREMKRRNFAVPVIVITGHGDVPMAVAALKGGAVDFLEKPFDSDALLASIEEALRRNVSLPAGSGFDTEALSTRFAELTPREQEVMTLVVAGEANKVIANRLGIALRTVEIHRARVMDKTGARNLSELIRMAIHLGRGP